MKEKEKEYNEALEKHLAEDIDWDSNTLKNPNIEDLKQFAADSFYAGYYHIKKQLQQ